jgi:hypothetical protein
MPGRPARSLSPASPPPPYRGRPDDGTSLRDRTSLIVRLGLLLLFLLGVGSVFGESLMGLVYPPAGASGSPESPPSAPK